MSRLSLLWLTMKMEKEVTSLGMRVISGSWKSQGNELSPKASRKKPTIAQLIL
jgi:hypothetical protein